MKRNFQSHFCWNPSLCLKKVCNKIEPNEDNDMMIKVSGRFYPAHVHNPTLFSNSNYVSCS